MNSVDKYWYGNDRANVCPDVGITYTNGAMSSLVDKPIVVKDGKITEMGFYALYGFDEYFAIIAQKA